MEDGWYVRRSLFILRKSGTKGRIKYYIPKRKITFIIQFILYMSYFSSQARRVSEFFFVSMVSAQGKRKIEFNRDRTLCYHQIELPYNFFEGLSINQ